MIGLKNGKVLLQGEPEDVITPDSIEEVYGIRLGVERVNGHKIVMTVR